MKKIKMGLFFVLGDRTTRLFLHQPAKKLVALIFVAIFCSPVSAKIPEPDNIVYGSLTYNNVLVTSASTELTVRFELYGNEIASYQIGSESVGDNFVLRIPIDVLEPRTALTARPTEVGEIYISKTGVNIFAGNFTVGERGTVQQLSISGFNDTDGDGMPDEWEMLYGFDPNDPSDAALDQNGNGVSNLDEFLNGTDPTALPDLPDGDLNNDGIVNAADVLLATQILLGQRIPSSEQLIHADVTPLVAGVPEPDGQFTVGDLVAIQRKALGIINF